MNLLTARKTLRSHVDLPNGLRYLQGVTSSATLLLGLSLLLGCDTNWEGTNDTPDASPAQDGAGLPDGPNTADAGSVDARAATTYTFTLDAGAFAPTTDHPSVLVYIPTAFDPTPPISVVVYIHGFNNCVTNIINNVGASCNARSGTPVRSAYHLAEQLEAAGKNAILLCPEVAFDQASANPGRLGQLNGFRDLLGETLTHLAPALGTVNLGDIGRIVVTSHSGGYGAAAGIAQRGGLPVSEVLLLDSLYSSTADFDAWVRSDIAGLGPTARSRRFANIYTSGGGTLTNSQQMANRAATWVPAGEGILIDDRTTAPWADEAYDHGLLFKLSALPHDDLPRSYFAPLIRTSGLPSKPSL